MTRHPSPPTTTHLLTLPLPELSRWREELLQHSLNQNAAVWHWETSDDGLHLEIDTAQLSGHTVRSLQEACVTCEADRSVFIRLHQLELAARSQHR